jgi:hypothetical protein
MLPGEEKSSLRFESALKRALKEGGAPASADCPAADVLAAYYDRSMARAERAGVEAHLARCARCASTLAMMARADSAARSSERAEHPRAWFWTTRVLAPASLAGLAVVLAITLRNARQQKPEVVAMASRRADTSPPREAAQMQAPANELAQPPAAPAPGHPAVSEKGLTAQAPMPAPAHAEARHAEPETSAAVAPPPKEEVARNEASTGEFAKRAEIQRSESEAERPTSQPASPEMAAKAAPASAPSSANLPPSAQPPAAAAPGESASPAGQGAGDLQLHRMQTGAASSAAAAPPAATASSAAAGEPGATVGGSAEPPQRESAPISPSLAASTAGAGVGGAAAVGAGTASTPGPPATSAPTTLQTSTVGGNQIYSPDRTAAWQVGPGGAVMKWTTGAGWHPQRSGVSVDLVAGFAPSDTVCWVVGKSGIVIRTIDGGENWEVIVAPTTQNLTSVIATGSDNASIVAADGARYTTHDGGETWSSGTD